MKFFHRHQIFNHLYCVFNSKDLNQLFNDINYITINESILISINNNVKFFLNEEEEEPIDPLDEYINVRYLIYNIEIEETKGKTKDKNNKINILFEFL